MKAMQLLMTAIFTFSLCLTPMLNDVYAKSDPSVTAAKSTKTAKTSVQKVIPKNININTADQETLTLLPGIGPVKADAILKYRKDSGKFNSIDDLANVKGIGEKTLKKLKPFLTQI